MKKEVTDRFSPCTGLSELSNERCSEVHASSHIRYQVLYIQLPVLTGKQHLCDLLAGANYHADLINKAVGRWGDLSFFLGGRSLDEEPWTPDINVVRSTIKFAQLTKRLNLPIRNSSSAGVSYDTTHHTTAPSLTNVRSGPCLIYR